MPKKRSACCAAEDLKVEAVVSIDERGQMVLPKEIRERAGIRPGDKLAVITKERDGRVCCIYMFRSSELTGAIRERFGPLLDEIGSR